FLSDANETFGGNTRLAYKEHFAGVAVEAILDDRHVDIDDVAVLQDLFVAGDTVADHMVDGGADGFGKASVVQWRRNGLLNFGDVFVADAVQLLGADAGF